MDVFIELLVNKRSDTRDMLIRFAILLPCSVFMALMILLTAATQTAMPLLFGAGAIYLMWYLLSLTFIEYEYILTNNELDIDKILGKKKRKRLITIKLNNTEHWGKYSDTNSSSANTTVAAHDGTENVWYFVTNHEGHGKLLVLFSPNGKLLSAINRSMPHRLRIKEVEEHED